MSLVEMDSLFSGRIYYENEKVGETYLNYSVPANHYWLIITITKISASPFENYKSILH